MKVDKVFGLNRMPIRVKLFFGFGIVCLSFIVAGLAVGTGNSRTIESVFAAKDEVLPHALNFVEIRRDIEQIQQWLTDISATRAAQGYDDGYTEAEAYYQDALKRIGVSMAAYGKSGCREMVSFLAELRQQLHDYYGMGKKMARAYIEGGSEKGNAIMRQFDPYAAKISESIGRMLADQTSELELSYETILQQSRTTSRILLVVTFVAVVLSAGMAFLISNAVSAPLSRAVRFAGRVAAGDLSRQLEIRQKDEIGLLADSLNDMAGQLGQIFTEIAASARTLKTSADQLSSVSEQIGDNSAGTAEKTETTLKAAQKMLADMNSIASQTDQTTASINTIVSATEEMGTTINEISKSTVRGNDTSSQAVKKAEMVLSKVGELGLAASGISRVTETIMEISEQTNLLALNATIEAARAGNAGKGFTVVAGEIKALARQTVEATDEIKEKISGIQTISTESIGAIESIVGVINELHEIVSSVAAAIEEQSASTREISSHVSLAAGSVQEVHEKVAHTSDTASEVSRNMSEVNMAAQETRIGSRTVNESASELAELAARLNETMERFKI